ncbi:hypothetical protein GQ55_3G193800 [Panicum hallii var. hallii]|uniref:Uncharacterized protein n=1 Tax=Panicum hallii var. hallii TaxID=1504633 RepID=A0A2T7EB67_9POAL|nr:hypothetical protein GQ55_3G193800 [Panicum hallii var. hallii]
MQIHTNKAYIQQRFLCSMWNARVISTATSRLKAGRISENKIYSYLCIVGIPSVSLHWQFLLRQLGFMHAKCCPCNHLLLRLRHYLNKHSLAWRPERLASFKQRGGPFHEHIPKGTG